jgi:hypothetical protein
LQTPLVHDDTRLADKALGLTVSSGLLSIMDEVIVGFNDPDIKAFQQGLEKLGWVEGQNIHIESRYAPAGSEVAALANEFVALQPEVIFAQSRPVTEALMRRLKKSAMSAMPFQAILVDARARLEKEGIRLATDCTRTRRSERGSSRGRGNRPGTGLEAVGQPPRATGAMRSNCAPGRCQRAGGCAGATACPPS